MVNIDLIVKIQRESNRREKTRLRVARWRAKNPEKAKEQRRKSMKKYREKLLDNS